MMQRPGIGFVCSASGIVVSLALASGCGGDSGSAGQEALVVLDIPAQTVLRNTLTPRTVDVSVEVDGLEEAFEVSLTSDNASVVADERFACTENPCAISFTPAPDESADVTVTVHVDADGALGETDFPVTVVARLVRSRLDGDPAPADTLRDVVGDADEGDVVAFDTEGEFSVPRTVVLDRAIQLQKDLTIEGHGAESIAVSGDMTTGLFVLDGGSRVVLRDFTLTRSMQTDPGGAVNVATMSTLTVERCHFTENRGEVGAGIYSAEGNVALDGASFTDNVATMSGAAVFAQGGSLRVLGGTTVADNASGVAGAIHMQGGTLTVEDSVFERNLQTEDGGEGGAIRVAGENASTTIDRTVFEENAASYGGAVAVVLAMASVSGSTFRGNSAEVHGAGLFANEAHVALFDSVFETNNAVAGAGISGNRSVLEIDQCTFENNEGTYIGEGAAIDASGFDQTFLLRDSRVLGTIGGGAAVFVEGLIATIEDVEISGSRTEGLGGGLYMSPRGASVVRRARIVNNRSEVNVAASGGGILARQPFLIEDCEILDNHAILRGGGISTASNLPAPLVIRNTLISGNTVQEGPGGGLFVDDSTLVQLTMGTRLIANVTEKGDGGGAYVDFDGELQIEGSDVGGSPEEREGNVATEGSGGGIYVRDGGRAELTMGARLAGNSAQEGGGGYIEAGGELAATQCEVEGNGAFAGGGIFNRGHLELSGTTVTGNFAIERGGGIAVDLPGAMNTVDLGDLQIEENRAVERGAGLWVNRGRVRASDSALIASNEVDEDGGGGGIYVEVDGDVCGVPFDRVIANRAGPGGLENNIEPLTVCP